LAIQDGNNALARRDYTAAEQSAREVLSTARTSPRAYDAQFLLAQALAGQRQFPQSAIAYDDAYNRNRKGTHAQEALVGLAAALTALNEKKAGCDTLTKLANEFPQLRPDLRDSVAATRQRAGCK
jgi:TolA-binding protein